MSGSDVQQRLDADLGELEQLRAENERLRRLLALAQGTRAIRRCRPTSRGGSSVPARFRCCSSEKVALIRDLFGRDRVRAALGERPSGRSGYVPATADRLDEERAGTYLPLSDETIERHLRGQESIGVYPLKTTRCWFLACDFDEGRGSSTRSHCSRHAVSAVSGCVGAQPLR